MKFTTSAEILPTLLGNRWGTTLGEGSAKLSNMISGLEAVLHQDRASACFTWVTIRSQLDLYNFSKTVVILSFVEKHRVYLRHVFLVMR